MLMQLQLQHRIHSHLYTICGYRCICVSVGNFSSCIVDYNAAAAELFSTKPDVVTADLHAAVSDVCGTSYGQCNLQLWGDVHFTEAGIPKQLCAVHVAKNIAPLLGPKWAQIVPTPAWY